VSGSFTFLDQAMKSLLAAEQFKPVNQGSSRAAVALVEARGIVEAASKS